MTRPRRAASAHARGIASDLRGIGQLAVDGTTGVTDLVEAVHATILHPGVLMGRPAPTRTRGLAALAYGGVRQVTRLVGAGLDLSLRTLDHRLGHSRGSSSRHAFVSILNGVIGDHLEASGNPLAITMGFRSQGAALAPLRRDIRRALPAAGGRLLVQVHGLCMNDLQWRQGAHDHGSALGLELGLSVVHLHYNTGRHIGHSGADLARLLQNLLRAWPVPVQELTLLCHSMGGLVARSAIDHAIAAGLPWASGPLRLVFLGTPHHGAPLERAGRWVDTLIGLTPYSAPFARLGRLRSAGIQDLRHGNLRAGVASTAGAAPDADPGAPMPLPAHVAAYAVAASIQPAPRAHQEPSRTRGDGLVPVASALGLHPDRRVALGIPRSRQWTAYGLDHLQLLGSAHVYDKLLEWLRPRPVQRKKPSPQAPGAMP
jgi:hypothetical protein